MYLKNSNETKNKIHKSISRGTFLYSPQTTTNASLQPTNPKPQGLLHSTTHLRTRSYSHHFTPISPSTEFRSGPHHFSRRPLARASHRNLPHTRERQSTLRFAPSNRPIESRVQMGLLRVLQPDLRTLSFEARKKNPNIKDVRDRDAAALLDRQTDLPINLYLPPRPPRMPSVACVLSRNNFLKPPRTRSHLPHTLSVRSRCGPC